MNFIEIPEGLEFTCGITTEMVTSALDKAKIDYELDWEGYRFSPSHKYFRESNICLNIFNKEKVLKLFREPNKKNNNAHFYFARYKVGPDFDWKKISGTVTFFMGNLIERVRIDYRK